MKAPVPRSGVTIGDAAFEWREVAKDYHLPYQRFLELAIDEQAAHIAHHRITNRIQAVLNKDAHDKAERARKHAK